MRHRSLNQLCRATHHRHFYESKRKWQKAQSRGSRTKALVSSKRHLDKTCSSTVPALKAQPLTNSTKGSKCLSQRDRVQKGHELKTSNRSSRSDIIEHMKSRRISSALFVEFNLRLFKTACPRSIFSRNKPRIILNRLHALIDRKPVEQLKPIIGVPHVTESERRIADVLHPCEFLFERRRDRVG
jgi:hypothetical protein